MEETSNAKSLSLRDILLIIFKRRNLFIGIIGVTTVLVIIASYVVDLPYKAKAEILIERSMSSNLPSHTVSFMRFVEREEIINSEVEVMSSYEVAKKVVDKLNIPPSNKLFAKFVEAVFTPFYELGLLDRSSHNDRMVSKVQKTVKIKPVPKSDVIQISYSDEDPEIAAKTINTLVDSYLERRYELMGSSGMQQFYEEQVEVFRKKLDNLREAAANVNSSYSLSQIIKQQDFDQQAIENLRTELLVLESDRRSAIQKLESLRRSARFIPFNDKEQRDVLLEDFGSKLLALQLEKNKAEQDFKPDSVKMRGLEGEIKGIRASLFVSLQAICDGLDARIAHTRSEISNLENHMNRLQEARIKLDDIEKATKQAEQSYRNYIDLKEQVRLDELSRNSLSSIKVISRATVPEKPVIQRLVLILIAFVVSGIVSFGTVLVLGYFNQTIDTADDVKHFTGLSVFAVLPEFDSSISKNLSGQDE
jgi:uncharacterized protein involved in exopolysaccharide biosynthesis